MRLTGTMLMLALTALAAPSRLEAAAWSEVFAADTDTMVFIGADGTLLRAPFSLATRETLWTPPPGQNLVRIRVSPDGRRVAWLARGFDQDTTRLWVNGAGSGGPRVRYFALLPDVYGRVHSEAALPSLEDAGVRGARLVQPGPLMRRVLCNTLEWTPDSRAVVFGYDDGIAAVPVDGGAGFGVSRALAVGLTALEPAPIYLVDAVILRAQSTYFAPEGRSVHPSEMAAPLEDGRPVLDALELAHPDVMVSRGASSGTYVLYPMAHRWRVFTASDLTPSRLRAASAGTVWWAVGGSIRAIRTHDPTATTEVRGQAPVLWLGYDEARRSLLWAAGREVAQRPEDGGPKAVVLRTAKDIRAALPARTGRRVGFVAGDSLIVWDPGDGSVWRAALSGLEPAALLEAPEGAMLVAIRGGRNVPPGLARLDADAGRLTPLEVPSVKGGLFVPVSHGARVLLFDPGSKVPATLHVLDVRNGRWDTVENPGIAGWEPLEPR
jgi:hypothetical protein